MRYREIMNGQRRDPLAFLLRCLLRLAEVPYAVIMTIRNLGYDRGWWEISRCDAAVISIGNLTTGGTGKTPLVRYVARLLRSHGYRVALVSRGYGAVDGAANDEAMELAATLPDVPHLQNPDRVVSARIAVEELESQVILMDDGFQHRRLYRDLDIVVIDATCPFGYSHQLPRGLLRESVVSLRRAQATVLTRCDAIDSDACDAIGQQLLKQSPGIVWAQSIHRPHGLLVWPDREHSMQTLRGEPVAVVCAIGNPEAFVKTVRACGADVVDVITLADHDAFDSETMAEIRHRLSQLGNSISQVVCTHKDLVKIQTDSLAGKPLVAILIEIDLIAGREELDTVILQSVAAKIGPPDELDIESEIQE